MDAERRMDAAACDALMLDMIGPYGEDFPTLLDYGGRHGHSQESIRASIDRLIAAGKIRRRVEDGMGAPEHWAVWCYEAVRK